MPPTTCSGHCKRELSAPQTSHFPHAGSSGLSLVPHLDFHKVDGLHQPGLSSEHAGVQASPGSGNDLPAPAVDGIGVQGDIVHIKTHTAHVLLAQDALEKQSRGSANTVSGDSQHSLPAGSSPSAHGHSLEADPRAGRSHLATQGAIRQVIFLIWDLRTSYSCLQATTAAPQRRFQALKPFTSLFIRGLSSVHSSSRRADRHSQHCNPCIGPAKAVFHITGTKKRAVGLVSSSSSNYTKGIQKKSLLLLFPVYLSTC